jgi:hypothetical protein
MLKALLIIVMMTAAETVGRDAGVVVGSAVGP